MVEETTAATTGTADAARQMEEIAHQPKQNIARLRVQGHAHRAPSIAYAAAHKRRRLPHPQFRQLSPG